MQFWPAAIRIVGLSRGSRAQSGRCDWACNIHRKRHDGRRREEADSCLRRLSGRRLILLLAALLWTLAALGPAYAADPATGEEPAKVKKQAKVKKSQAKSESGESKPEAAPVVVDPDKDPDFALEGEFVGPISASGSKHQRLALQGETQEAI